MKNLIPRKFKFEFLPPHLVAFLTGVLLALFIGIVFRKVIDTMHKPKIDTPQSNGLPGQNDSGTHLAEDNQPDSDKQKSLVNKNFSAKQKSDSSDPDGQKSRATGQTGLKTKPDSTERITAVQSYSSTSTTQQDETKTEGDYDTWREILRRIEQKFIERDPNTQVMLTPRYRHNAKGLAITRGQFLDIVTNKAPANLPTRPKSRSVIFHALAKEDFEPKEFSKLVSDSNAEFVPLCNPSALKLSVEGAQRVTVLVENINSKIGCLNNLISSNSTLSQVTEFGVIAFTRGVTYFASISSKQKLFSLQMWNPDWLLETTVGIEENRSKKPALGRAQRLANVARALSQPSDVRVQVPASFRSIHGPALDPVDLTPPRPLILGNFALIPSHMPRGSLIATAYMAPDMTSGRSVTAKLQGIDKTKALVLATQGKSLQFMKVRKDK